MAYKKMSDQLLNKIKDEVKTNLHTSRDYMRNQRHDTSKLIFLVSDPYYVETFGIMRGLAILYLNMVILDHQIWMQ